MKIPQSYVQKAKIVFHIIQALLIFIAGCITLSVFTKGGFVGGGPKWFFALCFLTMPALVYLTMTPMWSRAVKFANAYAFVVIDALFCIFWLSAFISVALYNSDGIRKGAEEKKLGSNSGNCSTFAYGSKSKCDLSKTSVVFGAFVFVFFLVTAAISARVAIVFRKTGNAPWDSPMPSHSASALEAQHKDAWSTDTHEIDHPDHDSDTATERGGRQEEDEYALLHSTDTDEGRHPGRPWGSQQQRYDEDSAYHRDDEDTAYHRSSRYDDGRGEVPHNALSPTGYDDYSRTGGFGYGAERR